MAPTTTQNAQLPAEVSLTTTQNAQQAWVSLPAGRAVKPGSAPFRQPSVRLLRRLAWFFFDGVEPKMRLLDNLCPKTVPFEVPARFICFAAVE